MKRIFTIINYLLLVSFIIFSFLACQNKNSMEEQQFLPTEITVKEDKFIDNYGREIILNGINVVSKSKSQGYIPEGGSELYKNLKKWGVNSIRLIIIWDRLEPEPGIYNEDYLNEIDELVELAKQNDLHVVLDMHQDLFSVKYSDGAPEWATLDEGKTHTTGAIWSDAYMMSEAVQTSFDNFWLNKNVTDGIGLQDHYAALWKHIAKRYANNSTIIGYDIMNEPFPGSTAIESTMILLNAYGQLIYSLTGEVLTEKDLIDMWGDEKKRMEALDILSTKENYHQVISQLFELNSTFEITKLQPFYQKVSNAIRTVDENHILFLEHSYYGNTGVLSSISRVSLSDGKPDPLVAYAPHGYDLVTDTESVSSASNERVAYIYGQIKLKGEQLNMPIWLGEWGAFYKSTSSAPVAKDATNLIEKHLFGNAYWSYFKGIENVPYFQKALLRPYPMATNGKLISYSNNTDNSEFSMEWQENGTNDEPTIIYVPHISKIQKEDLVKLKAAKIQKIIDSDAGYFLIPSVKKKEKRNLSLHFNL